MAKKDKSFVIKIEKDKPTRWCPDPFNRARVIPNKNDKKAYSRKARNQNGFEPFDFVDHVLELC